MPNYIELLFLALQKVLRDLFDTRPLPPAVGDHGLDGSVMKRPHVARPSVEGEREDVVGGQPWPGVGRWRVEPVQLPDCL